MTIIIKALLLTVAIEGIIMLALTRSVKWLLYNILVNALTNPLLNLALLYVSVLSGKTGPYVLCLLIGEVIVIAVEACLYRAFTEDTAGNCIGRSLITNLVSVLIGAILI